ncbi:MAG TPA: PASTA domain-containing protein [Chloroflexota bacterium]|nr:PASTA domain-containing protein [Chloroflexota bacterium]
MWNFLVQDFLQKLLSIVLRSPRQDGVPDLSGLTREEAHQRLLRSEYFLARADGDGVVVRQTPAPGSKRKAWSPVQVELE